MTGNEKPNKPATTIQSVSRAARILMFVATSESPPTARMLSDALSLTLPTTYHLLATLEMEGLLARDSRRAYMLGPASTVIAEAVRHDDRIPQLHAEGLRDLSALTGEMVYLSAWRQGSIRVLESLAGTRVVGVNSLQVGYSGNLHARASAKLLLAFAPRDVSSALVETFDFEPLTPNTITGREAFLAELDTVRAEGLSFDLEEFAEGMSCVSAPIRSADTVVACYTVSVPAARFAETRGEIISSLLETATRAST